MTQGFLQATLGRTRSGLRLARSALILARTRTASGRVEMRKLLRAGCQSRPSSDTPPPVTERRQYRCSGLLPLSPASWCYPAGPSQTGAGRWDGLCRGSSREATEDSYLDAVAGVCRDHDLATTAPR